MAFRSTTHSRLVLTSLAVAGALTGSISGAAAQYYVYEEEEVYPRGYYDRYAPRPPAPIPPRTIGRIAAREFGLAQVDRLVRTSNAYVVDGQTANGRRTRLIFDVHNGNLIDSIPLPAAPAPRIARVDPRDDDRPSPRIAPRPPERPASLKPPSQVRAPATIQPPSPAAPAPSAEPDKPAEKPPETASAPATTVPVTPATPAVPSPGPVNPATGEAKPQLVNPNDVRGTDEPDRKPPLAQAEASAISVAPVALPPVQIDDAAPSTPRPETPAVPVTPMD